MNPALEQLVREAMELTGASRPDLLQDDAPVLNNFALDAADDGDFYLVGLIGGKDVGKSALVNALVGKPITAVTSHGAGTEIVIAYAHAAQQPALRALLERATPGQYRIITHDLERLRRQVLLDLPDIDSRYAGHLEVTRTMLRHLLFPVWVGSVEKYADQQPQQMLARVSEGNTPGNFIFCLNKVDQVPGSNAAAPAPAVEEDDEIILTAPGVKAATPWGLELEEEGETHALPRAAAIKRAPSSPLEELREDYGDRIMRTLKLAERPQVYLISARHPTRFELPALRELLSRQKSADVVRQSKQLAAARQDRALLGWINDQQLAMRAQRLAQLSRDADETVAAKVGGPLLQRIIPRLLDDAGSRMAMADEILQERVARWPIVNLVHTLLQPVFVLLRSSVSRAATVMQGPDGQVETVIKESGESVASLVQSAFAQIRQSQPAVAALYDHNPLWDDMPAEQAAGRLRRALADTLQRQREAARHRFGRRAAVVGAPVRWLLTIGALLWFPFIQPILAHLLPHYTRGTWTDWGRLAGLAIDVLGVDYLLKSAGFLMIYYCVLWLALRWNTQRQVGRLYARWRTADATEDPINLAAQTVRWLEDLTRPIGLARDRMQSLADRAAALQSKSAAV